MKATGLLRWDIDDVLARTDLAALLDEVTVPATYTTRGRRWHCPVPDHEDRHASVTMHTDHRGHQRWRCWSGDDTHRGDAIDLTMATKRLSRIAAIDWLATRIGLAPSEPPSPPPRRPAGPSALFVPLDDAVAAYAQACERVLWTRTGHTVLAWLHDRGFSDSLLRANRVGADPGRRMMRRSIGLPYGSSAAATFPALDQSGEIQYVQARYLQPEGGRKYDNPATALGTNPRIAWTRTTGGERHGKHLLVCEGIPDALTAAQAGLRAAAILGSQLPDERVAVAVATYATQHDAGIGLVTDADPAGRACGERLRTLLAAHGLAVTIVEPPPGLDLNTWSLTSSDWHRHLVTIAGRRQPGPTPHHGIAPNGIGDGIGL
jgi:DNA primase